MLGLEYLVAGKLDNKELILAKQEEIRTKYPSEAEAILAQHNQPQNTSVWDAVALF